MQVDAPGVLAAMRAGTRAAGGEHIGFVDDDAEAREDWLAGVMAHFDDPVVGGVCGRDIVDPILGVRRTSDVGRITSLGKLVGNHHLGVGPARDVDLLKGADMVFRRAALALPEGLRGEGAQAHFEVATCLWAINQGWRLVYDPAAVVDHLAGRRHDEDAREVRSPRATSDAAFNLAVCIGTMRPELRNRRCVFGLLAGDRDIPGLLRAARAVAARDGQVTARLVPSVRGQLAGHRRLHRDGPALAMYCYPSPGVEVACPARSRAPTA